MRVACALAVLAVAGCGGSDGPAQGAGAFISRLVHDVAAGRHAAAWETLLPAHQHVAPLAEYRRCEDADPFPGSLARVEVLRVFEESVSVAGAGRRHSTAVRLRMTVGGQTPFDVTFHALPVEGGWAWYLPAARYQAYSTNRCP